MTGTSREAVERPALAELSEADRIAAVEQAREVTKSRVMAWRKRNRHMSWDELRILFVGLREMDDPVQG